MPRVLENGQPLPCARAEDLRRYRGRHLHYQKALRVHRTFVPRLQRFEAIVRETALAHYGRAPQRIVHMGAFNCRRMRRYPNWVSEHALGNAVDIAGFDFPRLHPGEPTMAGVPRHGFRVRVQEHWRGRGRVGRLHAAFLHALAEALIQAPEVFSVVLGPGWPGHHNHLHLDAAPYRVVEIDLAASDR